MSDYCCDPPIKSDMTAELEAENATLRRRVEELELHQTAKCSTCGYWMPASGGICFSCQWREASALHSKHTREWLNALNRTKAALRTAVNALRIIKLETAAHNATIECCCVGCIARTALATIGDAAGGEEDSDG